MEIKSLKNKKNVTMVDVAKAVLDEYEDVMHFNDILDVVAEYMKFSDQDIERYMPTFYSDLNTEGSFISVGNNTWGLREWYPIDSINEAVTVRNNEDDLNPHIAPEGYTDLFDEPEEDTTKVISNVKLDEEDLDYEEEEDKTAEEIQEYEDELSELEVDEDEDFDDELEYDEDEDDDELDVED